MSETATITSQPLLNDSNVLEFLKLLNSANKQSQANEYAEYFGSIDAIQTQLNETLDELKNVRKQLDALQAHKNPIKKAFSSVIVQLHNELQAIQMQLNELKEKMLTSAKNAVQFVKENGLAALNGVFKFFAVKEDLQATINSASAVMESCNKSVAKIESISNEYHAIGLHTRNFGRAVIGKEAVQDQKQKGKLAKALQSLIKFRKNYSAGLKKRCENSLARLENLENAVQNNRSLKAERKRPSLLKRIENYKYNIQIQETSDKPKKHEVDSR